MINKKPQWIAAITRGHNAGVCLLENGQIVFSIEEERLSRHKYDGGPLAAMIKIREITDRLDYLVVAHTQPLAQAGKIDFTGDDIYTGLARKLGLIDRNQNMYNHPQVIDLSHIHHKLHAACAFYRSGFDEAVAVIVDGAGTFIDVNINNNHTTIWEVESIFSAKFPDNISTLYKHYGTKEPILGAIIPNMDSSIFGETDSTHEAVISDRAGIVKAYEAVTNYCGFDFIEAGKTMGLFPYGNNNTNIPELFDSTGILPLTNRNLVIPTYPNGAIINKNMYQELQDTGSTEVKDVTLLQNRRDLAYSIQTQSQEQVLQLIYKAIEISGCTNVVVSGGYGLNCVANYYYLDKLPKGTNLYVEPISNDAGTAIGAALLVYHNKTKAITSKVQRDLYLGPWEVYNNMDIIELANKYNATIEVADHIKIVELLCNKNIVALFQGRSENGPRALGNRSILFDPRFEDGKDYVNRVKRREYFRPFAGSILEEDVHDWFDLRGMPNSPHMMYAVNCQPGVAEKIPSIIHVDGTCRIQTVNRSENGHYYDLIKCFKDKTNVPVLFNTSFNLGGEPLVENLDDALRTLANSEIEYLYLPEYGQLLKIANQ